MSDDLRARIAKALQGEADDGFTWEDWLPLADAVIRELGLKSQWINDGIISDGPPPNWVLPCDIRYTTDWEYGSGVRRPALYDRNFRLLGEVYLPGERNGE